MPVAFKRKLRKYPKDSYSAIISWFYEVNIFKLSWSTIAPPLFSTIFFYSTHLPCYCYARNISSFSSIYSHFHFCFLFCIFSIVITLPMLTRITFHIKMVILMTIYKILWIELFLHKSLVQASKTNLLSLQILGEKRWLLSCFLI